MTEVATPYQAGGWLEGLVYDEERRKHTYNGVALPSVTQVTRPLDSGLLRADPELVAAAAERGDKVHQITQFFDEDDLDESTVDPALAGYLDAWKKFRLQLDFEPEAGGIERVVLSRRLHYTGRADRVGSDGSGRRIVIDIKTGMVPLSAWPQLAAYAMALNEEKAGDLNTPRVSGMYVVQLSADGDYRLHHAKDIEEHYREFTHMLAHYRYLEKYA